MESMNLNRILFFLSHNHYVDINYLSVLSLSDIEYVTTRFPYSMALILKHGNTIINFAGKLKRTKYFDCCGCGTDLSTRDKFEVIEKNSFGSKMIEYICVVCWYKRTHF